MSEVFYQLAAFRKYVFANLSGVKPGQQRIPLFAKVVPVDKDESN